MCLPISQYYGQTPRSINYHDFMYECSLFLYQGFPFFICNPLNKNSGRTIYLIVSFFFKATLWRNHRSNWKTTSICGWKLLFSSKFVFVFSVSLTVISKNGHKLQICFKSFNPFYFYHVFNMFNINLIYFFLHLICLFLKYL